MFRCRDAVFALFFTLEQTVVRCHEELPFIPFGRLGIQVAVQILMQETGVVETGHIVGKTLFP